MKYRAAQNVSTTWGRRVVPCPISRTLQILDSIRQRHPEQANCGHGENFPAHVKITFLSTNEGAEHSATDLANALTNPTPAAPFALIGQNQLEATRELAKSFEQAFPQPK